MAQVVNIPRLVGLGSGLCAGVAYLAAAAPSVGWQDSGELVSAAFQLGVPHPTGFPAVMLLAKAASLVPIGTVAMRMACLSALCAAIAVGLLAALAARVAGRLGAPPWAVAAAGILAAFGIGASQTLLQNATTLEAYAPSLAMLATMMLLGMPRETSGRPRAVALMGLIFGVGGTTHIMVRLHGLLPLAAGVAWSGRWKRAVVVGLATALLTSIALVYIPLASLRDPPVDWGDPETISALTEHLSGGRIRRAFAGRMLNAAWVPFDAEALYVNLVEDLGPGILVLALVGLVVLGLRRRREAALLGLVAASDFLYSVLVNPMGIRDRQVGLPLEAMLAVLAGVGAASLALRGPRLLRPVAAGAALLLAAAQPVAAAVSWRGSGQGPSSLIARSLEIPPRSSVLCATDALCGGLLWAQYVEGDRPDVLALPRQHLWDEATLRARLPRHAPQLEADLGTSTTIRELVPPLLRRGAVFWEGAEGRAELGALPDAPALVASAPPSLFEVGAAPMPASEAARRLEADLRRWYGPEGPEDVGGREHVAFILDALAVVAAEGGERALAEELLRSSLRVALRPSALLNLAALEARAGQSESALGLVEVALEAEPGHGRSLVAAGRLHLAAGRDDRARPLFELARRLCPERCGEPLEGLGILAAREGRLDDARTLLREALRREPSLADARVNLELLDRRD